MFHKKKNSDADIVEKKTPELMWLRQFANSMDPHLIENRCVSIGQDGGRCGASHAFPL